MSRASRARRVAAAAAFGGGGIGALGAAGLGLLAAEAKMARRWIGTPFGKQGPQASGVYGSGADEPIEMAMLGDSSAVGLGVEDPRETPGAVIAGGLAAITGRPVRLTVVAVVGAESRHLEAQIDRLVETVPAPHVAVVMVGANDVTHRVKPVVAVRALSEAVRRLRELGAEVVVGTCPDLGTIEPIAQPLRYVARRWSRDMAAAQTIGVVEAGGRTVSLANLIGEEFAARPREFFSADRFHPSAAGYARAAAVLLPSVCAALDTWPEGVPEGRPAGRYGIGTDDVAHAAVRAAASAGTEVSGTAVGGANRGPRGRWARLLRRPSLPNLPAMPSLPLPTLPALPSLPAMPNLTIPALPGIPGLGLLGSRLRSGDGPAATASAASAGSTSAGSTSAESTSAESTSTKPASAGASDSPGGAPGKAPGRASGGGAAALSGEGLGNGARTATPAPMADIAAIVPGLVNADGSAPRVGTSSGAAPSDRRR